jgi:RNA polymerase sigma-70 factor (ECF subfamily)
LPSATSFRSVESPALDLDEIRSGLLVLLRRRVDSRSTAEDLCNEAIRILLERLRQDPLDDPTRIAAYVAQVARNLAIAERRKTSRQRTMTGHAALIEDYPDERPDPAQEEEANSRSQAVRAMLEELPKARDRKLLLRYYVYDEPKEAICQDMKLTPEHFNRVLFRARNRLREFIERRGGRDRL